MPVQKPQIKEVQVGETIPGSKVKIDSLKLTKSPITLYMQIAYHLEDENGKVFFPDSPFPPRLELFDRICLW